MPIFSKLFNSSKHTTISSDSKITHTVETVEHCSYCEDCIKEYYPNCWKCTQLETRFSVMEAFSNKPGNYMGMYKELLEIKVKTHFESECVGSYYSAPIVRTAPPVKTKYFVDTAKVYKCSLNSDSKQIFVIESNERGYRFIAIVPSYRELIDMYRKNSDKLTHISSGITQHNRFLILVDCYEETYEKMTKMFFSVSTSEKYDICGYDTILPIFADELLACGFKNLYCCDLKILAKKQYRVADVF